MYWEKPMIVQIMLDYYFRCGGKNSLSTSYTKSIRTVPNG